MADVCVHNWIGSGLWDGVTKDGKSTGGVLYKCSKCAKQVIDSRLKNEGGEIDKNFNIMGKPIVKK